MTHRIVSAHQLLATHATIRAAGTRLMPEYPDMLTLWSEGIIEMLGGGFVQNEDPAEDNPDAQDTDLDIDRVPDASSPFYPNNARMLLASSGIVLNEQRHSAEFG